MLCYYFHLHTKKMRLGKAKTFALDHVVRKGCSWKSLKRKPKLCHYITLPLQVAICDFETPVGLNVG